MFDTTYSLTGALERQMTEAAGAFGVVNRSSTGQSVTVTLHRADGIETVVTLQSSGDSLNVPMSGYQWIRIEASSYPCVIAYGEGAADILVTPAQTVDVASVGAVVDVEGTVAHDAADSGKPIKVGGVANASAPAAVADGDRVNAWLNPTGQVGIMAGDYGGNGGYDAKNLSGLSLRLGAGTAPTPVANGPFMFNGSTWDRQRTPSIFKTRTDASVTANTPVALWTPAAGKKFRVMGGQLSLAVAGQIILKDGTTEILRSPQLVAGATWTIPAIGNGILSAAANNVLNVDTTATGNIGGFVFGTEE